MNRQNLVSRLFSGIPRVQQTAAIFFLFSMPILAQVQAPLDRLPEVELSGLEPSVADQLARAREWTVETWTFEGATMTERMDRLWDLSVAWHAYDQSEAALTGYLLGQEFAPSETRWSYAAGVLLHDLGEFEKAAQQLRKALEDLPESLLVKVRLAISLREVDQLDEAVTLLHQVLAHDENRPAALAALGEILIQRGEFETGVEQLEEVLRVIPEANRLHYPLAIAYRSLGDSDKAREHLRLRGVVGVRPEDPFIEELASTKRGERLALIRGREAFKASRYDDAVEAFSEAIGFAPERARGYVDRSAARAAIGSIGDAMRDLERALEIEPENSTARFNLGRLLLDAGQPGEAVQFLDLVVSKAAGDAEANRMLGIALRRSGNLERAVEVLEFAVALDPALEQSHLDLAAARVDLGLYAEAVQGVEDAYFERPNSGLLTHLLARLLSSVPQLDLRDGDRALRMAQLVYGSQSTVSHAETVAMALAELGRCVDAREWQLAAIQGAEGHYSIEKVGLMNGRLQSYEVSPCRP